MARTRKISENDILDAAERVVLCVGASGLSIDAVAQEAGIRGGAGARQRGGQ